MAKSNETAAPKDAPVKSSGRPSPEDMPSPGRERRARGVNFDDSGALGLKHSGGFIREEFLKELQGNKGMRTIREMMDNDPIVGAFLFAVEQAIRQVDWKVIPAIAQPPQAYASPADREAQMASKLADEQAGREADADYRRAEIDMTAEERKAKAEKAKPKPKPVKKGFPVGKPKPGQPTEDDEEDPDAEGEDAGLDQPMVDPRAEEARKYANFIDSCRLDMAMTWSDVMTEALSFLPFGWSMLEVTYKVRRGYNTDLELNSRYEDGLVGWKKMEPRAQESLRKWIYDPVKKDKLTHMQQFTLEKGTVDIPLGRCLHFRTKSFKNNPEGRSILRNCYRPWYLKKRIEEVEGIGIERDMAGLPVLIAAEGADLWNESDPRSVAARHAAERIVRNIRVDEQMGVLLPFGWELTLLATGGKRSINTTDIINRYSQNMAMTVLADFIMLGHTNRMGSFALAKAKTGMFAMSLVGYLNVIRDTFNTYELPRLWRMNGFPMDMMPRLDYTPVDTPSLKDLASYITALSGAQVDFSVPELQRFLLQQAGIPADLTDLAGRGGTGSDLNQNGVPDDTEVGNEEDDDDEEENVQSAGNKARPSARPKPSAARRGVAKFRAPTRKTRFKIARRAA